MNLTDVQLALRAQALTLSVATTGSTSLAATSTGYTRAAGSFVTDGFVPGMEVLPAGFGTNTPRVIQSLTATAITVRTGYGHVPIEAAAAGRSLVCGLPLLRGYDNQRVALVADRWAVEEEFNAQAGFQHSTGGSSAIVEHRGTYIWRLYVTGDGGMAAPGRWIDDFFALFPADSTLTVAAGDGPVRIRGKDATKTVNGPLPLTGGWSVYTLGIPWWMLATNS